jgi:hypothetical protein
MHNLKKENYMKVLCVILLSFCLFQSCSDAIVEQDTSENLVSFYLLKDSKITATEAVKTGIESLQISDKPIFTSKEMSNYNWKDHSFSVDSVTYKKLQEYSDLHKSVFGIPFVVTVGKDRIYLGAIWFPYSSIAPSFPNMYVNFITATPITKLVINKSWSDLEPDIRSDLRIYYALKGSGLLIE